MSIQELLSAIQEAGAQNVIIFPSGRFQFVTRHGTFAFDTLADLERAFAPSTSTPSTPSTASAFTGFNQPAAAAQ